MSVHQPRPGLALRRRTLLGAAGLAATGLPAWAHGSARADAAAFDPLDWASVRAQFDLDYRIAQFSAFVLASHPRPVRRAIERHRTGLDRDTEGYLIAGDYESGARAAAASYLGASAAQVALIDSTTMGLGLLYSGIRLRPGQEALSTTHDFYSTNEGLRLMAARTGATLRQVRLYDDPAAADADEMVERLRRAIRQRTRLLAITWVHSGTGVRLPVRRIGRMLAEVNRRRARADRVLLAVDGVHGFGVVAQRVADLECDFFASGMHKWLFGPRGTGVLWSRAWGQVAPLIPDFSGPGPGPTHTPGGYHTFEHRWALPEAFAFVSAIGAERVERRTAIQASRLKAGLAEVSKVSVVTPLCPDLSAGIVCFNVRGVDPRYVVYLLREEYRVGASVTPYAREYARLGPSIVTTPDDVDRAVRAVAAIARREGRR